MYLRSMYDMQQPALMYCHNHKESRFTASSAQPSPEDKPAFDFYKAKQDLGLCHWTEQDMSTRSWLIESGWILG